jgi:hypothetical protein
LRGSVRAARAHPFLHPLPLVAEGSMITKAIQKDLVSLAISFACQRVQSERHFGE